MAGAYYVEPTQSRPSQAPTTSSPNQQYNAPKLSTTTDRRIKYKATVFENSQYERIIVDGEIHNSASPPHITMLSDMLSQGLITPDKFCEMYSALMRADRDNVSEISAIVSKNGKGKEFLSKGIYNSTAHRR